MLIINHSNQLIVKIIIILLNYQMGDPFKINHHRN
jgi:hypothetical protein